MYRRQVQPQLRLVDSVDPGFLWVLFWPKAAAMLSIYWSVCIVHAHLFA